MRRADPSGQPVWLVLTLLRNVLPPIVGSTAHTNFAPMSCEVSAPRSVEIHAQRSTDPNHRRDGTSPRKYVPLPARDRVRWPAVLLPWPSVRKLPVEPGRRNRPCCRRAPKLPVPMRTLHPGRPLAGDTIPQVKELA